MPISVDVPDLGEVEFPDSMPKEDIEKAIRTHLTSRALDVAVKSPVDASSTLLRTLSEGAEGADMGRRQDDKAKLQNEMAKARIERSWTDALQGAVGGTEAATSLVSQMDPINLLKRTLDVPAQLGGSSLRVGPIVSPEQVRQFIYPTAETPGTLREGVLQGGSEMLSGLTSPDQALALVAGKANPEAVARLFQVQTASQIPGAAQQFGQALQSGEPSEVGRSAFGLGASLAVPALIEKGISDAQGIRTDTGQLREAGTVTEAGQEASRDDLQFQTSRQSQPVVQGEEAQKAQVAPTVTETTPPAEVPSGTSETGLRPAIRLVGGDVVVGEAGQTHPDIISRDKLKATDIDQRGFVDPQGKFLDREQAATATGLPTEKEPQRLHSTDLPEAKEEDALSKHPSTVQAIAEVTRIFGKDRIRLAFDEYLKNFNLQNASDRVKSPQFALFAKNILANEPRSLAAIESVSDKIRKESPPSSALPGASPAVSEVSAATEEGGAAPSTRPAKAEPNLSSSTEQVGKSPIVGMGGAVPGEFTASQQSPTGIRNAIVDQERVKRGLPPAGEVLKRSFGQVWDQAMARIDQDPAATDELINSLKAKPRAIDDVEDAMLLQRQVDLQNEYAKATRDLAQAHDDGRAHAVDSERARVAYLSDKLLDLYNVGKKAGTETGRGLNARRMLANEDFSLDHMELEQRAAKGGKPLTDTERSKIAELHQKIAETQKAYDDYVAQTDARLAELENKARIAELSKQPEIPAPILQAAERLVKALDTRADAARSRLREKMSRFSAGVDPTIILDLAEIGAAHISRVGLDFAKWSARMLSEVGGSWHKDLPSLEEVFKESQKWIDGVGNVTEKVKSTVKKGFSGLSLDEKKAETVRQVKERTKEGDLSGISPLAQRIAKAFVGSGITDREQLIDAVHGVLAEAMPDITRRQAMDAISGYGEFKPLSKDEISVKLRGLKGEMQQLAKLEDMAKGEPPMKTGIQRREPTDAERALIKAVNDAKYKFQIPVKDPETQLKSALDTLKTTIENRIKDLENRIAKGDYSKKPRRELVLDDKAMRLKADLERTKKKFQEGVDLERFKNRPNITKAADWLTKLRRWQILSSPVSLAKLTAAAAMRLTSSAVEEGVGGALGKAIPGVAEKAPREGGLNVKTEVDALHSAITQGMKDAWSTLKTGKSDLDAIYGTRRTPENAFVDFWGRVHGMLKAPVKRSEFTRSLKKRMEFAAKNGVDVTNPLVEIRLGVEAYKDANRSIFLNNNRAVDAMKAGLARLEAPDKSTGKPTLAGKAGATAARIALPIVRVPTNIVSEAMQYAFGSVTGLARLGRAYAKGIENLKPEEADLIMRSLKKGSLGTAGFLVGFLNPDVFGGYYAKGEKRREDQPKFGSIKVYGVNIPSFLLHHPLMEVAQLGATIRRVAEENLPSGEKKGLSAGMVAGALGVGEQVPFVREMTDWAKVQDSKTAGAYFGELSRALVVPQLVQYIAQKTDTDSYGNPIVRKPRTFTQHLQVGIPGLRERVPEKR